MCPGKALQGLAGQYLLRSFHLIRDRPLSLIGRKGTSVGYQTGPHREEFKAKYDVRASLLVEG